MSYRKLQAVATRNQASVGRSRVVNAQVDDAEVRGGVVLGIVFQAENGGDGEGFVVGRRRVAATAGVLLLGELLAEGVGRGVIFGELGLVEVVVAEEVGQGCGVVVVVEHFLGGGRGTHVPGFEA